MPNYLEGLVKKIDLVILAAGKSSRFGSLKGFANYKGSPLLESAIQLHQNNFNGRTIIVFSKDSKEYKDKLEKNYPNALFTLNPTPEHGPFSSLKIGLKYSQSDYTFILPVDCPCRQIETWNELYLACGNKREVIKPMFNNKGGHPIIISKSIKEIIQSSPNDSKLNLILRKLPFENILFKNTSNETVIKNINLKKDLKS